MNEQPKFKSKTKTISLLKKLFKKYQCEEEHYFCLRLSV